MWRENVIVSLVNDFGNLGILMRKISGDKKLIQSWSSRQSFIRWQHYLGRSNGLMHRIISIIYSLNIAWQMVWDHFVLNVKQHFLHLIAGFIYLSRPIDYWTSREHHSMWYSPSYRWIFSASHIILYGLATVIGQMDGCIWHLLWI